MLLNYHCAVQIQKFAETRKTSPGEYSGLHFHSSWEALERFRATLGATGTDLFVHGAHFNSSKEERERRHEDLALAGWENPFFEKSIAKHLATLISLKNRENRVSGKGSY